MAIQTGALLQGAWNQENAVTPYHVTLLLCAVAVVISLVDDNRRIFYGALLVAMGAMVVHYFSTIT